MNERDRKKCIVCDNYEENIKYLFEVCENNPVEIGTKKQFRLMTQYWPILKMCVGQREGSRYIRSRYLKFNSKIEVEYFKNNVN